MKKTLFVVATSCALILQAKAASAQTTYQCTSNENAPSFAVQILNAKVPRVTPFDDATIQFADEKNNWDWMQLAEKQEGSLNSHYIYNLMRGGQLTIAERVYVGRGGGGRGGFNLENGIKTISAKLVNANGQASFYSCTKTN